MLTARVTFVVAALICFVATGAAALNILVWPLDESGHMLPLAAVVHEAAAAGHSLRIMVSPQTWAHTREAWPAGSTPVHGDVAHVETQHPDNLTVYQRVTEMSPLESLIYVDQAVDALFAERGASLARTLAEEIRAHPPDVILADYTMARVLVHGMHWIAPHIPVVFMWPLTLSLPDTSNPSLPALGTGYTLADLNPIDGTLSGYLRTLPNRLGNYALQRLMLFGGTKRERERVHETRALLTEAFGAAWLAERDAYLAALTAEERDLLPSYVSNVIGSEVMQRRFVITPSVFGVDTAQPLCPNIRPVGFLFPPASNAEAEAPLPASWSSWLDGDCAGRHVVYVNMGSMAVMPHAWVRGMAHALRGIVDAGHCVVWKLRPKEKAALLADGDSILSDASDVVSGAFGLGSAASAGAADGTAPTPGDRMAIVRRVPFSPRALLRHPRISVFVSHCGDTSVYESLDARTPIVGIPLFADQPNVCARLVDAGIGSVVAKAELVGTAPPLRAHILEMLRRIDDPREGPLLQRRLERLYGVGHVLGGAKEGARVLELAAMHSGTSIARFRCQATELPWLQRDGIDLEIALIALVAAFALGLRWVVRRLC